MTAKPVDSRPVDSGEYEYLLNGEPTAIEETWSRQIDASGASVVTSARSAPGIDIEVESRAGAGQVFSFSVQWRAAAGCDVRAEYSLQDNRLLVARSQNGGALKREAVMLERDSTVLLSPLMRIYTGPVIARLLQVSGQGTVVIPAIGEPENEDELLRPLLSHRQARLLETGIDAGTGASCRLCEYTGDQYGAGTQFWLGEDDMLLRYLWRQSPSQQWDVRLRRSPAD